MMTPLDLLIVVAFAAYAVRAGFAARRSASRGLESYFLADRGLSGWQAGASMAATQFAADTPILVTGLVATAGIAGLWRLWIYALAFLLLGFVLAPSWRRARVLTDAELTELRYAGDAAAALRAVKAVYFGTIFNCTVLAMVLWAAKEIAEPFLTWHLWLPPALFDAVRTAVEWVGVPFARGDGGPDLWVRSTSNVISLGAIVSLTTLYSATGGLRSVVRTDVAQLALMLAGTALYAGAVVREVGGLSALAARLGDGQVIAGGLTGHQILAFGPGAAGDVGTAMLTVLALQWLVQMNADGTGYLAQRSMACRSDRDARIAAVTFTGLQILLRSLLWLPIAVGLLVLYPASGMLEGATFVADREATFVRGMVDLLPPGAAGLMVTAMLAALASTIDTHLNWGAAYWTNDLYRRFWCEAWRGREPADRTLVWVARAASLSILLVSLAIMTRLDSIQTAWHASLLLGAGMGTMLVLRGMWWRVTAWGELAAIAVSSALAPLLLLSGAGEASRLLVVAAASTAAGVVASLLTTPLPDQLVEFYRRARPPGFWTPVALACGGSPAEDARRLRRGLLATVVSAAAMFAMLVGCGRWILGTADGWSAFGLIAGLVLVPIGWRLGDGAPRTASSAGNR